MSHPHVLGVPQQPGMEFLNDDCSREEDTDHRKHNGSFQPRVFLSPTYVPIEKTPCSAVERNIRGLFNRNIHWVSQDPWWKRPVVLSMNRSIYKHPYLCVYIAKQLVEKCNPRDASDLAKDAPRMCRGPPGTPNDLQGPSRAPGSKDKDTPRSRPGTPTDPQGTPPGTSQRPSSERGIPPRSSRKPPEGPPGPPGHSQGSLRSPWNTFLINV